MKREKTAFHPGHHLLFIVMPGLKTDQGYNKGNKTPYRQYFQPPRKGPVKSDQYHAGQKEISSRGPYFMIHSQQLKIFGRKNDTPANTEYGKTGGGHIPSLPGQFNSQ